MRGGGEREGRGSEGKRGEMKKEIEEKRGDIHK